MVDHSATTPIIPQTIPDTSRIHLVMAGGESRTFSKSILENMKYFRELFIKDPNITTHIIERDAQCLDAIITFHRYGEAAWTTAVTAGATFGHGHCPTQSLWALLLVDSIFYGTKPVEAVIRALVGSVRVKRTFQGI